VPAVEERRRDEEAQRAEAPRHVCMLEDRIEGEQWDDGGEDPRRLWPIVGEVRSRPRGSTGKFSGPRVAADGQHPADRSRASLGRSFCCASSARTCCSVPAGGPLRS
jgi:hypothetical protein